MPRPPNMQAAVDNDIGVLEPPSTEPPRRERSAPRAARSTSSTSPQPPTKKRPARSTQPSSRRSPDRQATRSAKRRVSALLTPTVAAASLADPRSRSDLLRAAYNNHIETLLREHEVTQRGPMLIETVKRAELEDGPMKQVMLNLTDDERDLLDDASSRCGKNRSWLVTELLAAELGVASGVPASPDPT